MKISGGVKKGEALVGTAVEYAPYVEFGTRRQNAQPYLAPSIAVVKAKAVGAYKEGMLKEIRKGLANKYKQAIAQGVDFIGVKIEDNIDDGIEVSVETLAAAAVAQAKAICPVKEGTLRKSIMYKTTDKEGGFGHS